MGMNDSPSPGARPVATGRRTRGVIAALVLVVLATSIDGALLWRTQQRNEAIAAGRVTAERGGTPPSSPELRFALAAAQAASGSDEADLQPDGPSRSAERAATTMRAYSPGLP